MTWSAVSNFLQEVAEGGPPDLFVVEDPPSRVQKSINNDDKGDIVVPKSIAKTETPKEEDEDDDVFYDTEDDPEDETSDDLNDSAA
ncbi:hypothetical protein NQ318_007833 [Aromia moschata]|uniref:Uncharacterized protein n=1 Tax=Aromia moschata TaxID=1265417 RepID=A0AAV8YZY6_9CUCU|nr:hypothetical protein NQ318_007833 [Aromia moschata]